MSTKNGFDSARTPFDDAGHLAVHVDDIHSTEAVRASIPNARARLVIGSAGGGAPLEGRSHGVAIVLDAEDAWKIEDGGHVHGLVHGSLIQGSITEEARGHGLIPTTVDDFILIFGGEGQSGTQRTLRTHDAMTAKHEVVFVEEVHRPTLALGTPIDAAKEFGKADLGIQATRQCMTMISVCGNHGIGMPHGGNAPHSNCFLPVVDVQKPASEFVLVGLHGPNLEFTNSEHVRKPRLEDVWPGNRHIMCLE